ncbi:MAG: uncharacterized membrane protein YtjA (UPF0391 family) [Alphaproteobacteria bacterium]|jgi:uncharacterized membrane protein YtjA (UPF0391 family)
MDDKAVFKSVFPAGWTRELTYRGKNPLFGTVLHNGDRVFEPVSAFSAWIDKIVLLVWLLTILVMLVHSFVWSIQRPRGRLAGSAALRFWLSMSAA